MPPSRDPRPGLGSRAKGQSPDSRLSASPAFPRRRWRLRVRSPVTVAGPCRARTGFLDPFTPCLSPGSIAGLPAHVNQHAASFRLLFQRAPASPTLVSTFKPSAFTCQLASALQASLSANQELTLFYSAWYNPCGSCKAFWTSSDPSRTPPRVYWIL